MNLLTKLTNRLVWPKGTKLTWRCDSKDRMGTERGVINRNGEWYGYMEKGEAQACAKRHCVRLTVLPSKVKTRKRPRISVDAAAKQIVGILDRLKESETSRSEVRADK